MQCLFTPRFFSNSKLLTILPPPCVSSTPYKDKYLLLIAPVNAQSYYKVFGRYGNAGLLEDMQGQADEWSRISSACTIVASKGVTRKTLDSQVVNWILGESVQCYGSMHAVTGQPVRVSTGSLNRRTRSVMAYFFPDSQDLSEDE